MKKGFTLIELLIVMVIVGVLVTVALPKYRLTLERGRAVEAIANLKAASDWVNAQYVINGNSYPATSKLTVAEDTHAGAPSRTVLGFATRSVYFSTPEILNCGTATCTLKTDRLQGGTYRLQAVNSSGVLSRIECSGLVSGNTEYQKICEAIGMEKVGTQYKMQF